MMYGRRVDALIPLCLSVTAVATAAVAAVAIAVVALSARRDLSHDATTRSPISILPFHQWCTK